MYRKMMDMNVWRRERGGGGGGGGGRERERERRERGGRQLSVGCYLSTLFSLPLLCFLSSTLSLNYLNVECISDVRGISPC